MFSALQAGIASHGDEKAKMPEDIEPPAALNPRTKKAFRRKRARKGERMRNDDQGRKEVAICEDQDCT
jgi:hypothetical protein